MGKGSRKVTLDRARDEAHALGRREALASGRPTAAGAAADDGSRICFVFLGAMARRDNRWSVSSKNRGGGQEPYCEGLKSRSQCPSFALPRRSAKCTKKKRTDNYVPSTSNALHRQALDAEG